MVISSLPWSCFIARAAVSAAMAWPRCHSRAHDSSSTCRHNLTPQSRKVYGPDHGCCTPVESDRRHAQHRPACLACKNVVSQRDRLTYNKRPGRRKCSSSALLPLTASAHVIVLFIICLLCTGVLAESRLSTEKYSRISAQRRSLDSTLARRVEDLVDHSKPSKRQLSRMRFAPRQDDSSTAPESTITIPALSTTASSGDSEHKTTTTVTATSSLDATATVLATSSLPKPFDTSLGNNFTSTCLPFLNGMLNNQGFEECVPFSLLLQVCTFLSSVRYLTNIVRVPEFSRFFPSREISCQGDASPRCFLQCELRPL